MHALDMEQTRIQAINAPHLMDGNASIEYTFDGHFYTAGYIAFIAGYQGQDKAQRISCFTQKPDEMIGLNAIYVALMPLPLDYRHQVVNGLHSLHGGNTEVVLERRKQLKRMIIESLQSDSTPDWQTGFLIHAFGDSFAHTKGTPPRAYGEFIGHAFDSLFADDPDAIFVDDHPTKYIAYVRELFDALRQGRPDAPADEKALAGFITAIEDEAKRGQDKNKKVTIIVRNGIPSYDWDKNIDFCRKEKLDSAQVKAFLKQLSKRLDQSEKSRGI